MNKKNEMELIYISKDIFLYSSFYYVKEKFIQIIGYIKYIKYINIKCYIIHVHESKSKCNFSYDIIYKLNSNFLVIKIFAKKYSKHDKVLINNKIINPQIIESYVKIYNCTLCITKFINYTSYTYLLEAINSYKLIGIDHIVIYYLSSSLKVYQILKYYEKNKLIDIISWNFYHETVYLKKLVYGQIWKYNDCFYRFKYSSKLLLFNDIDEILWSNKYNTIEDILSQNSYILYDVLYIHNRIFRKELYSNNNYTNSRSIPYDRYNHFIPDFSMFSYHNSCTYRKGYLNKYIIKNSNKIKFLGIHQVLVADEYLKIKYINSNDVFLRHTRRVREDLLRDCKNWTNYYSDKEMYILNITNNLKMKIVNYHLLNT